MENLSSNLLFSIYLYAFIYRKLCDMHKHKREFWTFFAAATANTASDAFAHLSFSTNPSNGLWQPVESGPLFPQNTWFRGEPESNSMVSERPRDHDDNDTRDHPPQQSSLDPSMVRIQRNLESQKGQLGRFFVLCTVRPNTQRTAKNAFRGLLYISEGMSNKATHVKFCALIGCPKTAVTYASKTSTFFSQWFMTAAYLRRRRTRPPPIVATLWISTQRPRKA